MAKILQYSVSYSDASQETASMKSEALRLSPLIASTTANLENTILPGHISLL